MLWAMQPYARSSRKRKSESTILRKAGHLKNRAAIFDQNLETRAQTFVNTWPLQATYRRVAYVSDSRYSPKTRSPVRGRSRVSRNPLGQAYRTPPSHRKQTQPRTQQSSGPDR